MSTPVELFDISPVTGQLAYVSNNRLWLADASGNNPQAVDTAAAEKSANLLDTVSSLAWSPDGSRLAFAGQNGVWLYEPVESRLTHLYANPPDVFALWLNAPYAWSPDGETLLLKLAYADSDAGSVAAMSIADGGLTVANNVSFCYDLAWSRDSQWVYAALGHIGVLCPLPGLVHWSWQDNATVVLIASEANGFAGRAHYAQAVQEGPDGQLYYFYGTEVIASDEFRRGALAMYRSAQDGTTGRTQLRSDVYALSEALWSPDASLAVIVNAGSTDSLAAIGVLLLTTDGAPAVQLASAGHTLRWGVRQ